MILSIRNQNMRNFRLGEATVLRDIEGNHETPLANVAAEDTVDENDFTNSFLKTEKIVLSCGHTWQYKREPHRCFFGEVVCGGEDESCRIYHCSVCNTPLCKAHARRHPFSNNTYYCQEHRLSWIIGR